MPEGIMYSASTMGAITGKATSGMTREGTMKQKAKKVPNGEGAVGNSRQLPANSGTGPQDHSG